ncbi:hypothetical protein ABZP36_023892 [Zizania latifolia]
MGFSSQVDVVCTVSAHGPSRRAPEPKKMLCLGLGLKCKDRRGHVGRVKSWSSPSKENPPKKSRTYLASSSPRDPTTASHLTGRNYRRDSLSFSPSSNRALRGSGVENPGGALRRGDAARRGEWKKGMWWEGEDGEEAARPREEVPVDFDFIALLSKPKDYYKILEVEYDASEETIRSNYIRLALKWHPDKKKGEETATSRFQEINEAYQVLSNPVKRQEYDKKGIIYVQDQNVVDYLNRHKGLILTCNGLGIRHSVW